MYQGFFGLSKGPFHMTPDPGCVYMTSQHVEAISGLVFGILDRKGYLVLTGEAGLGKTTALSAALQLAGSKVQSSLILNPTLTASEFLETVMLDFGIENIPQSKAQRLKMLQEFLLRGDADGKISVVIVDEAHTLSVELLEEIRLLGNFDFADHKLLQIVLVGQEELNPVLNRTDLRQLKQRLAIRLSLRPLDTAAVRNYIQFRWQKAGGKTAAPFSPEALDAIASCSNGIPRLVNAICDNALLLAFAEEARIVDVQHIREAAKDLDLAFSSIPVALPKSAAASAAVAPVVNENVMEAMNQSEPAGYRLPAERESLRTLDAYSPQPSLLSRWFRWASQSQ
jgi:general secretion pathway protein A